MRRTNTQVNMYENIALSESYVNWKPQECVKSAAHSCSMCAVNVCSCWYLLRRNSDCRTKHQLNGTLFANLYFMHSLLIRSN